MGIQGAPCGGELDEPPEKRLRMRASTDSASTRDLFGSEEPDYICQASAIPAEDKVPAAPSLVVISADDEETLDVGPTTTEGKNAEIEQCTEGLSALNSSDGQLLTSKSNGNGQHLDIDCSKDQDDHVT